MASSAAEEANGPTVRMSRRKLPPPEDLRSMILAKLAGFMRCESIGIIGAQHSGRNTLVRRFSHMSEGPFAQPDGNNYNRRHIFIELSDRPNIPENETVRLDIHIMNARIRSYEALNLIVPNLKMIAMVFDVGYEVTLNIAIAFVHRMRQRMDDLNIEPPPIIMIGNKIDQPVTEDVRNSNRERATAIEPEHYFECSAWQNLNMDPVLDAILNLTFFRDRDEQEP